MPLHVVPPDRPRTFVERDCSIAVACPDGCVRGTVYFDSNAVAAWLRGRRRVATLEQLAACLRCSVCSQRPVSVRHVTKLYSTRLARLPGMAERL